MCGIKTVAHLTTMAITKQPFAVNFRKPLSLIPFKSCVIFKFEKIYASINIGDFFKFPHFKKIKIQK